MAQNATGGSRRWRCAELDAVADVGLDAAAGEARTTPGSTLLVVIADLPLTWAETGVVQGTAHRS